MELTENQLSEFEHALLLMDKEAVGQIIMDASAKVPPIEVATELVAESLSRIGIAWSEGRVSLSQVYMGGVICEEIIERILPAEHSQRVIHPKMGIAVFEDYHVLGKRIVYSTLRAAGFELLDLGSGASAEYLMNAIQENQIKIMLLSVLMLPAALHITKLVDALRGTGVRVIVGGSPFRFDPSLCAKIGADGTGRNASEALVTVKRIISEMQ